jgi:hypothetical protein
MSTPDRNAVKSYCNALAIQRGVDAAGSARMFDAAAVVEIPLPWKRGIYDEAGALPQQVLDLFKVWLQRYREGLPYNQSVLMIAPDPQYSRPGFRRVIYYKRPAGQFAQYDKVEYLVPEDQFGVLIWALFEARDELLRFQNYLDTVGSTMRDLFVCTHGTVDAACAKFGYPLYKYLREQYADAHLRIWRVSHFGGHLYAPTLIDMPVAHYWAYVEAVHAQQIVQRSGNPENLRTHYRGSSAFEDGLMQAAERDVWQREGWEWFNYPKSARILEQDKDMSDEHEPAWAQIQFNFTTPDGAGSYRAHVEIAHRVETEYSSHDAETYAYPQYRTTLLEKTMEEKALSS